MDHSTKVVAEMAGVATKDVRLVLSPYRVCPLGAHIDHQVKYWSLSIIMINSL